MCKAVKISTLFAHINRVAEMPKNSRADKGMAGCCAYDRPTMEALRSHSFLAAASFRACGAGFLGAQSLYGGMKKRDKS